MEDLLSKAALRYIAESMELYLEKSELVTSNNVDSETYTRALKKVKKMTKKLTNNPEKYLDYDYLDQHPEVVEQLEHEAEDWESMKIGRP